MRTPQALEHERTAWLTEHHRYDRVFADTPEVIRRDQSPSIPNSQMLPLWVNLVGIVDIDPDEVFESGVSVETGAVLADLDQPLPDDSGRRVDRNRLGRLPGAIGVQVIAGQGHLPFSRGGAQFVIQGWMPAQ